MVAYFGGHSHSAALPLVSKGPRWCCLNTFLGSKSSSSCLFFTHHGGVMTLGSQLHTSFLTRCNFHWGLVWVLLETGSLRVQAFGTNIQGLCPSSAKDYGNYLSFCQPQYVYKTRDIPSAFTGRRDGLRCVAECSA